MLLPRSRVLEEFGADKVIFPFPEVWILPFAVDRESEKVIFPGVAEDEEPASTVKFISAPLALIVVAAAISIFPDPDSL